MELTQGTVVAGRFRLVRELGHGGMGSVWAAHHTGLDIPCAVKFIHAEVSSMSEIRARFEREAKAAASLRSPNVVQILDYGVSDGIPYIAMEYLDGEDLAHRLARVGRLAAHNTVAIVSQVARALVKAHAAGLVHRDLKPENVYLVRDDDREIAKVLDFGIAKSNAALLGSDNATKTGSLLGTPHYMSPEQAQGTKAVDYRSDLWSLAVMTFRCVTGKLPFNSEALGNLLVQIIVNQAPIPSQVAPDVPRTFDAWWARAAARDPAQRFQSAKELADSLAVALGISHAGGAYSRPPSTPGPTVVGTPHFTGGGGVGHATPAPGYAAPAPGYAAPAPGYATPAPGHTTPAPGHTTPAPGHATPAPGYPTPAPGYPTPAPGYPTPAPGYPTPAPVHTTPSAGYPSRDPSGMGGHTPASGGMARTTSSPPPPIAPTAIGMYGAAGYGAAGPTAVGAESRGGYGAPGQDRTSGVPTATNPAVSTTMAGQGVPASSGNMRVILAVSVLCVAAGLGGGFLVFSRDSAPPDTSTLGVDAPPTSVATQAVVTPVSPADPTLPAATSAAPVVTTAASPPPPAPRPHAKAPAKAAPPPPPPPPAKPPTKRAPVVIPPAGG